MFFNFIAILCLVEYIVVIANGLQEQLGLSHYATLATNSNLTTTLFANIGQTIEYSNLSGKESAIMASDQNKEYFK